MAITPEVPKQSPPFVIDDLGSTIKYILSGGISRQAIATLTHSQMLTLNTVGVEVIPASGVNRMNIPVLVQIYATIVTPYVNALHTVYLVNDATGDFDQVTVSSDEGFLAGGTAGTRWVTLSNMLIYSNSQIRSNFYKSQFSNWTNKSTIIYASGGALTGGAIGNTMRVTSKYYVYDIVSGLFV